MSDSTQSLHALNDADPELADLIAQEQARQFYCAKLIPSENYASRAVLQALSALQMVDVTLHTTDGRELILRRYTEPAPEQAMVLEQLNLTLPPQPLPRIRAGKVELPATSGSSPSKT